VSCGEEMISKPFWCSEREREREVMFAYVGCDENTTSCLKDERCPSLRITKKLHTYHHYEYTIKGLFELT